MSKSERIPVKSKEEVVGYAEYKVYDSTSEAVADIGEAVVLSLINAQVKTNAMNRVRSEATGEPTKEYLRAQAMGRIKLEEFQAVAGDAAKIEALVKQRMDEVKTEIMEQRKANAAAVAAEAESSST